MNHLAVAAIVLEKPSDKSVVPGQSSRTGHSNGKTRYDYNWYISFCTVHAYICFIQKKSSVSQHFMRKRVEVTYRESDDDYESITSRIIN
jgi:hypothetical protein